MRTLPRWRLWSPLTVSVSLRCGAALRTQSPLCVLLSMTEWSGSEFTYRSSAASNQATKPKLCGLHVIQQNKHQLCPDADCSPRLPFQSRCGVVQLWGRQSPLCILLSMTEWSESEFTNCSSTLSNQATKPKLRRLHVIPQNKQQLCPDGNCGLCFKNAFCLAWMCSRFKY